MIIPLTGFDFYIEFKKKGETPRKLQKLRHAELEKRHKTVYICDCYEEFHEILALEGFDATGSVPGTSD